MSRLLAEEETDFPVLCADCLGENPYLRMAKEPLGKDCKVCSRPFTVFKWNPGKGLKQRKTELCQLCAKLKNVCQSCILDLDYKLPTHIRDAALNSFAAIPKSDVNTEYFIQNMAAKEEITGAIQVGKAASAAKEILKKMSANPYSLEQRKSKKSVMDTKQGDQETDGMERKKSLPPAIAPADKSITTLYMTGIENNVTESDLRHAFYAFGEIKSLVLLQRAKCAFVTFAGRLSAEMAMEKLYGRFKLRGKPLKIQWGKASSSGKTSGSAILPPPPPPLSSIPGVSAKVQASSSSSVPMLSLEEDDDLDRLALMPPPPGQDSFAMYPSMDPKMLGTATKTYRA